MTPRNSFDVEDRGAGGPFRRVGWFRDNEWGLIPAAREEDYDQNYGGPWYFSTINNALTANYATRNTVMLREGNQESRGTSHL